MKKTRPLCRPCGRRDPSPSPAGHPRQRLQPLQITSICGYGPLRSQERQIKTNKNKKDPGRNRGPIDEDGLARRLLVATLLERGTENVAQRRPRIGGAVLRD